MFRLDKIACGILIVFFLAGIVQSKASYITKKSDTTKEIEKIEKAYADGLITKSACTKKKSKALKLGKTSKTICDNVEVKVVKKEESKEKKKIEYIKKKKKKERKAKKEFLKKTKDLSKKAKSWITKKIKKEKHYKTIAKLPKADFYFTATDDKGNIFIGYVKYDQSSENIEIGNKKFKKVSKGQAFQDDGKTQCVLGSEMDEVSKYTKLNYFTGKVIVSCPDKVLIGIWHQTGNEGVGIGKFDDGTELDFAFSANRNDAVVSLNKKKKESKETKQLVKKEEKNYEIKDISKPVIKIAYNKKWFDSSIDKEVTIESSSSNYIIEGKVEDKGGSEKIYFRVNGRPFKIKDDGSFEIKRHSNQSEEIWLTAIDAVGNPADFQVNVKILLASSKFINDKKYYALIIGNNDYDDAEWDDLESPINDVTAISTILKKKYKFIIRDQFILINATKSEIEEAFYSLNELLTEEDYLLIYYAGHGSKNTSIQRAFWIPIDAKKNCCRNWINTSTVTDMIGIFKAKHVLLMVDSCFSGVLKGDDENLVEDEENPKDVVVLNKWMNRKVRLYISSGSNEPVLDKSVGEHSYFAKKFIELLKINSGNMVSLEVFSEIDRYVQNNASQRPKYKVIKETGHNEGRFIFSVRN